MDNTTNAEKEISSEANAESIEEVGLDLITDNGTDMENVEASDASTDDPIEWEENDVQKILTITVSSDALSEAYNKELDIATKLVKNMKGFRPGKVPKNIVAAKYSREIKKQVTDELISSALREIIDSNKWNVVGNRVIQEAHLEPDGSVSTRVIVFLYPSLTDIQWQGLNIEIEVDEFNPDEVEHEIKHLRILHGDLIDVKDRIDIRIRDFAIIRLTSSVDGTVQERDDEPRYVFIQTQEESTEHTSDINHELSIRLVGKHIGEKITFNYTFPVGYKVSTMAGKEAICEAEISGIKIKELHEINADFFKKVRHDSNNIDELRESILLQQRIGVINGNERARNVALVAELIERNPMNVPALMVYWERVNLLKQALERYFRREVSDKELYELLPISIHFDDQALTNVKGKILLDNILSMNKWHITDEEFDSYCQSKANLSGVSTADYMNFIKSSVEKEAAFRDMANIDLAMDRIAESATISKNIKKQTRCLCQVLSESSE